MPKIIKATIEQQRSYRAEQAAKGAVSFKPLYGYAVIQGHQCAIEYLGEGKDNPNYEIFAPEGYSFGPELHSELYEKLTELRAAVNDFERCKDIQPCDADCPCEHGATRGAA